MSARAASIFLLVFAATAARADDVVRDTRHAAAEHHVALAERLEKKHPREACLELLLALEMDPDDAKARAKLGYTKDENKVWRGAPQVPAATAAEVEPAALQEIDRARRDAASKLARLAKRLRDEKKPEDARLIAGLALDENPDEKTARDLLGMEKRGEAWTSARELKIRAAFAKALEGAKGGEVKASPDDDAFEKLCGVGALDHARSPHAALYWSKEASKVDAAALLRLAEASWLAHRYFVSGDDAGFTVEGEPKRAATGVAPAPRAKPYFLVVTEPEHAKFVEAVVTDPKMQAFAKGLGSWADWKTVPTGSILLSEASYEPELRGEWVSGGMASFLTQSLLGDHAELLPNFLDEGLSRFFSGHVSGRAEIDDQNAGASSSARAFEGGSFDALRARVRRVLVETPEGGLRALLAKKTNEIDQDDSAMALALVDFLLAAKRPELASFLAGLSESELPLATLERVLKKSVEDLERELRDFVRVEY